MVLREFASKVFLVLVFVFLCGFVFFSELALAIESGNSGDSATAASDAKTAPVNRSTGLNVTTPSKASSTSMMSSASAADFSSNSLSIGGAGVDGTSVILSDLLKVGKAGKKGWTQFSSTNSYYSDFDFVTDSSIRFLLPIAEQDAWRFETFVNASLQYQSAGAKEKYYDNNVATNIGLKALFFKNIALLFQTGTINYVNDNYRGARSVVDPKIILGVEHFWQWDQPRNFTEASLEFDYLPRLDSTPASSAWIRQGLRFQPLTVINLDTFAEVNRFDCRSPNMGTSATETRFGIRSKWENRDWNVAAVMYHAFGRINPHGDVDGALSVGGQF